MAQTMPLTGFDVVQGMREWFLKRMVSWTVAPAAATEPETRHRAPKGPEEPVFHGQWRLLQYL